MEQEREKSISELLGPIWLAIRKYLSLAIAPSLAVFGIGLVLAVRIPAYYQADTLIFMQPQRLASKIIEEQKRDEVSERLQALVQEILSRPRLRAIINRFKLYPEYKGVEGSEAALAKLKAAIEVSQAASLTGGQQLQTFKLSFSHRDADTTFEVIKAIANLFIEESVYDRRNEVQGTQDFFDAQLADARKKLEETENKVQEFVKQNFGKLPEHLEQAIARLQTLQSQLESNGQLLAANMSRRGNLETELGEVRKITSATVAESSTAYSNDPKEAVEQLEEALVMLQSKYTDQHPEVIATKKRIQALRAQVGKVKTSSSSGAPKINTQGVAAVLGVKRQLSEVDIAINALKTENENLKRQVESLNADIQEMPLKEQELLRIKRDYENLKATYQKLTGERDSAGLQASMLRSQKATQLRVVEPPEKPIGPAGPPRILIALGSLIIALAVLVAVPVAIYFLNGSFRSKEEVEETLRVKVLGVIPPMYTPEAAAAARRLLALSMVASVFSFAAVSAAIVYFVR